MLRWVALDLFYLDLNLKNGALELAVGYCALILTYANERYGICWTWKCLRKIKSFVAKRMVRESFLYETIVEHVLYGLIKKII